MRDRLSSLETATALSLSEFTLARMRRKGIGPAFIRLRPNRVEYLADSVQEYLEARTTRPSGIFSTGAT
jgi:hypothetical protein